MEDLKKIDIYLLDQIFKGRYQHSEKILDAGCGSGRNMLWFVQNGYHIEGCDLSNEILETAKEKTGLSENHFRWCPLENMPYEAKNFDHIICNAVLHFANSYEHFFKMIREIHRVLNPGGSLFIRMTSNFGLSDNYTPTQNGRFLLADGTERFLLTDDLFGAIKSDIGFEQIEPLKSTLVEKLRSMSTLMLIKRD